MSSPSTHPQSTVNGNEWWGTEIRLLINGSLRWILAMIERKMEKNGMDGKFLTQKSRCLWVRWRLESTYFYCLSSPSPRDPSQIFVGKRQSLCTGVHIQFCIYWSKLLWGKLFFVVVNLSQWSHVVLQLKPSAQNYPIENHCKRAICKTEESECTAYVFKLLGPRISSLLLLWWRVHHPRVPFSVTFWPLCVHSCQLTD